MNKEEKEAIEILEEMLKNKEGIIKYHYWIGNKSIEAIETILNLISKYEENYISKDTIKNKIEELKNKKEKIRTEKGVLWGNVIYITDIKMKALEELLEEKK